MEEKQVKDFDQVIRLFEDYKKEYGDILVPERYTTKSGIKLGKIVKNIRNGKRKPSADEKAMLNDLGFVWKVKESSWAFEEVVKLLEEYKKKYGDLLVPRYYTTESGVYLGKIVSFIRSGKRKTSTEEKEMLDSIGFVWKAKRGRKKKM